MRSGAHVVRRWSRGRRQVYFTAATFSSSMSRDTTMTHTHKLNLALSMKVSSCVWMTGFTTGTHQHWHCPVSLILVTHLISQCSWWLCTAMAAIHFFQCDRCTARKDSACTPFPLLLSGSALCELCYSLSYRRLITAGQLQLAVQSVMMRPAVDLYHRLALCLLSLIVYFADCLTHRDSLYLALTEKTPRRQKRASV